MKIAYLSTFYPLRGGIAQFNALLYRELEKRNHNVEAWTFRRQYPEQLFPGETQYVQEGDKVDEIESYAILDSVNPANYITSAKKIIKSEPDVMITKYWMPFFAPSLGTVAKFTKKEDICNIAILDNVIPHEKRFFDKKLTNYFLNQYDSFIVMSDTVRDDLLLLKPDAKYEYCEHPIYNHFGEKATKVDGRETLDIPHDKKVILFFGFIRDYKGLDRLIKALKLLGEDYYLIIAGECYGDFDKYAKMIVRLDLNNQVGIFNRYISDEEVAFFFGASDVCVLPYRSGTQSGIVGISYNFDLPVIATRVGSLPQMIEPYNSGMVIEKSDPEVLKEAIEKYFNENLKEGYLEGINQYKEKHSWAGIVDAIEKIQNEYAEIKEKEAFDNVKLLD